MGWASFGLGIAGTALDLASGIGAGIKAVNNSRIASEYTSTAAGMTYRETGPISKMAKSKVLNLKPSETARDLNRIDVYLNGKVLHRLDPNFRGRPISPRTEGIDIYPDAFMKENGPGISAVNQGIEGGIGNDERVLDYEVEANQCLVVPQ